MTETIADRMARMRIELPTPAAPAGAYVPYVRAGALLVVAGQLPIRDGAVQCAGRVGETIDVDAAVAAARLCGLNLLAQVRDACDGDLGRVRRVVRLGGFVAASPDFTQHPRVLNGASELMVEVFGDLGRHARFAVGASSLPLGAAVEVDGMFEIA